MRGYSVQSASRFSETSSRENVELLHMTQRDASVSKDVREDSNINKQRKVVDEKGSRESSDGGIKFER